MIRRVVVRRRETPARGLPGLHPVAARVLAARGLTVAPDYALSNLLPPKLGGLERACELLVAAIEQRRRILVVGDFDADGATGTALAVAALQAMGASGVRWCVPDRFRHGYGLSPELVAEIGPEVPDLLITVDQGVSSLAGVRAARERGMQVIVTDHHLPGDELPAADAMVNPVLPGENFGSRALAGVGVVFYLLMALRGKLRDAGHFRAGREPRLDQWLDLVALGTVADLVPLDNNNRCLVHQGLMRIRAGRCSPGVRALLEIAGRNLRHATAADLGFAAAPRLNAAGRLDDMGHGIRCLLAASEDEARQLAEELDRLNRERQTIQSEMQADADAQARELAASLESPVNGLCIHRPEWHPGVVGLVAGRLMEQLQRPVVAFAPAEAGSSLLKGSARSPSDVHMRDLLVAVDAACPGLIQRFGGHARAAGLSLPAARLEAFREAFEAETSKMQFTGEQVLTDGELAPAEISLETAAALEQAGPWGQAFPEPLFDGCFEVRERRVVGERHLKLRLGAGDLGFDAIAFGAGSLCHRELPSTLHLTYRLEVNRWRGRVTPQLNIQHRVDQVEKR